MEIVFGKVGSLVVYLIGCYDVGFVEMKNGENVRCLILWVLRRFRV